MDGVCQIVLQDTESEDDEDETAGYRMDPFDEAPLSYHRANRHRASSRKGLRSSGRLRGRREARYPVEEEYPRSYDSHRLDSSDRHKTGKSRYGDAFFRSKPSRTNYGRMVMASSVPKYERKHRPGTSVRHSPTHMHPHFSTRDFDMSYDYRQDRGYGRSSRRYLDDDFGEESREPPLHRSSRRSHNHHSRRHEGSSPSFFRRHY